MNKTVGEARDLVDQILRELGDFQGVDVVLCPPFTALAVVSEAIIRCSRMRRSTSKKSLRR